MVKTRVAYSVDTKNKAVEMKLQGYSTKQIMLELNIKTRKRALKLIHEAKRAKKK